MIAEIFLILAGVYLGCGLLFAGPFVLLGVKKVDPLAAHGSWGFRVLLVPGVSAFWPLLLWRWLRGPHTPPMEHTSHRRLAQIQNQPPRMP